MPLIRHLAALSALLALTITPCAVAHAQSLEELLLGRPSSQNADQPPPHATKPLDLEAQLLGQPAKPAPTAAAITPSAPLFDNPKNAAPAFRTDKQYKSERPAPPAPLPSPTATPRPGPTKAEWAEYDRLRLLVPICKAQRHQAPPPGQPGYEAQLKAHRAKLISKYGPDIEGTMLLRDMDVMVKCLQRR